MRSLFGNGKWRGLWGLACILLLVLGFACLRSAYAACKIACWEGHYAYNDYFNDYCTDIGVCITYAQNTLPDDQQGTCGDYESTERTTMSNATRYCAAQGYRGHQNTFGTAGGSFDRFEPVRCSGAE